MAGIAAHFGLHEAAEVAVEIDARQFTDALAEAYGRAGVNRASLGVQSFDPAVQRAINRVQPVETVATAVARLRGIGRDRAQFRPALRTAAPDGRQRRRDDPTGDRSGAGPVRRFRVCPSAELQEASAADRRGLAGRRPRPVRAGGGDRRDAGSRGLRAGRSRSFRPARRPDGRGAGGRHAAPQLPGLHHRSGRRPDRPRRLFDRGAAAGLRPERDRHRRLDEGGGFRRAGGGQGPGARSRRPAAPGGDRAAECATFASTWRRSPGRMGGRRTSPRRRRHWPTWPTMGWSTSTATWCACRNAPGPWSAPPAACFDRYLGQSQARHAKAV